VLAGERFHAQLWCGSVRNRPEAASQLAEMTHPNRPFISASEGQPVLISMATTSATIG